MSSKVMTWLCAIYLVLLLIFNLVAGLPLWWWLIMVVIIPVVGALCLRLWNWYLKPLTGLEGLMNHIRQEKWAWQRLEKEWIGRTVRLKDDIRNSNEPAGRQVYVQAGTLGKIVALNRDERAPFSVQFPGFAHNVVVRLEKLDLNPTENIIEGYTIV